MIRTSIISNWLALWVCASRTRKRQRDLIERFQIVASRTRVDIVDGGQFQRGIWKLLESLKTSVGGWVGEGPI